jgi:hypothetical protein
MLNANDNSSSPSSGQILTKEQIREARLKKMGLPCSEDVDIPITSSSSSPSILSNAGKKQNFEPSLTSSSTTLHLDKKQTLGIYEERLLSDYEITDIKRYLNYVY